MGVRLFAGSTRAKRNNDASEAEGYSFLSKVAGVSFKNANRTSRQKIIREDVYSGMRFLVELEDRNEYDANAIALFTPSGKQIGYLDTRAAHDARQWIRQEMIVTVIVDEITGGTPDRPTRGVNIIVCAR